MGLAITTREYEGWVVVSLAGEVDVHTVERMSAALAKAGVASRWMVVDCALLAFCDSSFLGTLVDVYKQSQAVGGTLVVAGAPHKLGRLLTRTGLDRVITVYPSVAEAVA